jgi:hypothetical protein
MRYPPHLEVESADPRQIWLTDNADVNEVLQSSCSNSNSWLLHCCYTAVCCLLSAVAVDVDVKAAANYSLWRLHFTG